MKKYRVSNSVNIFSFFFFAAKKTTHLSNFEHFNFTHKIGANGRRSHLIVKILWKCVRIAYESLSCILSHKCKFVSLLGLNKIPFSGSTTWVEVKLFKIEKKKKFNQTNASRFHITKWNPLWKSGNLKNVWLEIASWNENENECINELQLKHSVHHRWCLPLVVVTRKFSP